MTNFVEELVVDGGVGSAKCFGHGAESIDGVVTYKDFEHQFVEEAAHGQGEPFGAFCDLVGGLSKQEFGYNVVPSSPRDGCKS